MKLFHFKTDVFRSNSAILNFTWQIKNGGRFIMSCSWSKILWFSFFQLKKFIMNGNGSSCFECDCKDARFFSGFQVCTLQLNCDFQATGAHVYIHTAFIHNFGSPNESPGNICYWLWPCCVKCSDSNRCLSSKNRHFFQCQSRGDE